MLTPLSVGSVALSAAHHARHRKLASALQGLLPCFGSRPFRCMGSLPGWRCDPRGATLNTVIVWLAVALWLVIVGWSLALMRAAGNPEDLAQGSPQVPERIRERPAPRVGDRHRKALIAGQGVLLGAVVVIAVLTSHASQWQPVALVGLLAVLVVGSDFLTLEAKRFRISGSFLGLVLAMALLGPAPAVAMGIACSCVDAVRGRTRGTELLGNLATYAFFPLLGGLLLQRIDDSTLMPDGSYALSVFAVFVGANVLNFTMIATHTVLLRGGSLPALFRTVFWPVLPWELATGALTAMAVYGFDRYGPGIVGIFALGLGVCQLLLRTV